MDLGSIEISAGGMRAQRFRMDLIASNLANVDTTSVREETRHGADGRAYTVHVPYRRQLAVFSTAGDGSVRLAKVVEDASELRAEVQPGHPHAVPAGEKDAGTVYYPNVNPMVEMVDLMAASRAYEANLTAVEVAKSMSLNTLRILA